VSPEPESCWTAVANIVRERPYGPGGAEIRFGTKHFAPGAKVYIIDWYAGMCERIVVVGQHRKSKKLIAIVTDVKLVENLRAKVCYAPAVLAKIKQYFDKGYYPPRIKYLTQDFAELVCKTIPAWQAQPWRQPQEVGAEPNVALEPSSNSFLTRIWLHISFLLKN